MKIVDSNGRVSEPENDISWAVTLEKFIKALNMQKIPFKELKMFISPRPYVELPNVREVNIYMVETGTQLSDKSLRLEVVKLFNDNPQLTNAGIHPISKRDKTGKTRFASRNYVLTDYAKIVKTNGEGLDREQLERLNKNTDWRETLSMLIDQYLNLQVHKRVPRTRRSSSLHLSDLGEPDASRMSGVTDVSRMSGLSGIGVTGLRGRCSFLKHKFDKLQGEAGLGNDSCRVSRELRLLRKKF